MAVQKPASGGYNKPQEVAFKNQAAERDLTREDLIKEDSEADLFPAKKQNTGLIILSVCHK
jgi:hypothetical protein